MQRNLRYISPGGVRQDAAHAYLQPRLQDGKHPNLHVLTEHEVLKVTFEGTRAAGVVVSGGCSIKVKRMIVVSAGTLGTPLLLERSGVGSREVLARAEIDVVAELPGVGEQFQDHNTMLTSYHADLQPEETWDVLLNGESTYEKLAEQNSKLMGWNGAEITSKIRPTDAEIEDILDRNARELWDRDWKHVPNKPVATISTANGYVELCIGSQILIS